MIPFTYQDGGRPFKNDDFIFIPEIRAAVKNKSESVKAYIIGADKAETTEINLRIPEFTDDERDIILAGCLINYYKQNKN
jgi:aconitate hydratase